jgi:hypothetical protein
MVIHYKYEKKLALSIRILQESGKGLTFGGGLFFSWRGWCTRQYFDDLNHTLTFHWKMTL